MSYAQSLLFKATGVRVPLGQYRVEWPALADSCDWGDLAPADVGRCFGAVSVQLSEADAGRVLALLDNTRIGPRLFRSPERNGWNSEFYVCVMTRDAVIPGRRARRERRKRRAPTSRKLYDALLQWATPRALCVSRHCRDVELQSDDSTLRDPSWDPDPADDAVYGWAARLSFASAADYQRVREGCAGHLCGWDM